MSSILWWYRDNELEALTGVDEEWDDSGIYHIDIWVGNDWDGGDNQIICEKSLTPGDLQSIVRNPDPGLNVDRESTMIILITYSKLTDPYASNGSL